MDEKPVVSNTSPLIKLAGVGLLDLLPQVYGNIWIPEAVRAEYAAGASATDPEIDSLPWLSLHLTAIEPGLLAVRGLGKGEAESISLAMSSGARAIILDDRLGRREAIARWLPVVGTLSVLVRAKSLGLLAEVRPVVDQMVAQGRHISARVRAEILKAAGEDATT